jgi:hypothetical protein
MMFARVVMCPGALEIAPLTLIVGGSLCYLDA